jgi:hypothetical protein
VVLYPSFLAPYASEVTIILVFVDGLLFGLAIKKAIVSVVLLLVAFVISYFVGLAFIPSISVSSILKYVVDYAKGIQFGGIVVSFTILVFFIGLGIGIWKG